MPSLTYGFIGLGLIGGSIAKAIREKLPQSHIIAYDINKNTLERALQEGIANKIINVIDDSFSSCDYIFLCAPVQKNDDNLKRIKDIISPNCLITDVGSVKTSIHESIQQAGLSAQFIGGHPMAGSERVGYINSKAILLENVYYILTPTADVSSDKIIRYKQFVQNIGAIPLILSYQEHDYVTAAVSHLPHVIAASLVNLVRDSDNPDGIMKMIAAGGFKDITRIASSQATMWQQICLTNTNNISQLLSDYITSLENFKTKLDDKESTALYELFDSARIYRDSFTNVSSGPIKKNYTLSINILDQTGVLSSIITILANANINIKNLGITHNREDESGTLRIELYDDTTTQTARSLLEKNHFSVRIL